MIKESDETRGMSLRELVLEVRKDVKTQNGRINKRPTRMELWGTILGVVTLVTAIVAFVS